MSGQYDMNLKYIIKGRLRVLTGGMKTARAVIRLLVDLHRLIGDFAVHTSQVFMQLGTCFVPAR